MVPQEKYMRRALELASKGLGHVSPNPLVGCVIVHEDKIVGEGYHHQYGGAHAEVAAISSLLDAKVLAQSDLYVTLEPCAHHGLTPPCADLLVKHQVKRVIIAQKDPNPLVNGGGIDKLAAAGIEVISGFLSEDAKVLNRRFNTYFGQQRPYVILKWAQTDDGFIARENYDSKWISGPRSRQLVHSWRAQEDAILVGKNTVLYDDPKLTVRDWSGSHPIRIVIDHKQVLPMDKSIFDNEVTTYRYHQTGTLINENEIKLTSGDFLRDLLTDLHAKRIQSLIVEGGAATLQSFIDADLWDEARVFTAAHSFEKGISAPTHKGKLMTMREVGRDRLNIYEKA